MRRAHLLPALPLALFVLGMDAMARPPLPTVPKVDLERYMGEWYVIANIPTSYEKGAHNALETYRLNPDGTINTTFTYRKGSFDGPLKIMKPKGWVRDPESNAAWWMQFFWPLKAEYLIAYLNPDYSQTIVARTKRDYVWIMARTPSIPETDYSRLVQKVAELGYDTAKLERMPQRW
jgi:apolipoprotein D and lipocalin family protein